MRENFSKRKMERNREKDSKRMREEVERERLPDGGESNRGKRGREIERESERVRECQ